jgi:hypothetical protein
MVEIGLEYPNGRTVAVSLDRDVKPGMEFELYGRRWHALGPLQSYQSRNLPVAERRILCTSLGKVAQAKQGR